MLEDEGSEDTILLDVEVHRGFVLLVACACFNGNLEFVIRMESDRECLCKLVELDCLSYLLKLLISVRGTVIEENVEVASFMKGLMFSEESLIS